MKYESRKKAKLRFIRVKNRMNEPECGEGDFWCNHLYEPDRPWCWVDFRFLHTRQKKYYSVAMTTAEYIATSNLEDEIYNELEAECALPPMVFSKYSDKAGRAGRIINFNDEFTAAVKRRREKYLEIFKERSLIPVKITPSITIHRYSPVCFGLHATVNTPYIDKHYVREFITTFRTTLGEPTQTGEVWRGEEISVVPARLASMYDR